MTLRLKRVLRILAAARAAGVVLVPSELGARAVRAADVAELCRLGLATVDELLDSVEITAAGLAALGE
jgi:hypothetical protein